jgi:hypothetical protein
MITQETYKREKRRLAIAQGRFDRARRAVPNNPHSRELEGSGIARLGTAVDAARTLLRVASEGLATFELEGYPDTWHNWERAADDARHYLGRVDPVALRATVPSITDPRD